jgi:hypothetical protein
MAGMALLALTFGARAAQVIVISESESIGFARGSIIEEGTHVKVPAGQKFSLIDGTGKGWTIEGPFDGAVKSPTPGATGSGETLKAVKAILVPLETVSLGAIRGSGDGKRPPEAVMLDVSSNATQCVMRERPIQLWRPSATRRTTLLLTRVTTNQRGSAEWEANTPSIAWPPGVPAADGEAYTAQLTDTNGRARFTLKFLPIPSAPTIDTAGRLADAGCRPQAEAMLQAIADPAAAPK